MTQKRVSDAELKQFVSAAFHKYDKNLDGILDYAEVTLAIADTYQSLGIEKGVSEDAIKHFFKDTDVNTDGQISMLELFAVFQKRLGPMAV